MIWSLLEDLAVTVPSEDGPVRPKSLSAAKARFERHLTDLPSDLLELVVVADDQVIGQVQLHSIDYFSRCCELGIALGEKYWNRGFGQDAVRTIVDYGFDVLNMNRVGLRVLADDERAIAAYRKAGFVEEGRLRQHALVQGELHDDLVMGILRQERDSASGADGSPT